MLHRIILTWKKTNLIKRISLGILCGALLAVLFTAVAEMRNWPKEDR